MAIRFHESVG